METKQVWSKEYIQGKGVGMGCEYSLEGLINYIQEAGFIV